MGSQCPAHAGNQNARIRTRMHVSLVLYDVHTINKHGVVIFATYVINAAHNVDTTDASATPTTLRTYI